MDKMRSWREVLADCADCLESEVEARWRLPDGSIHPAQQRKYERDLEPVKEARALLAALPSCDGWREADERLLAFVARYIDNQNLTPAEKVSAIRNHPIVRNALPARKVET